MSPDGGIIGILSSIGKFDVFQTILGLVLLGFDFYYYTKLYYGFEGKQTLGIILVAVFYVGIYLFLEGYSSWNKRYKTDCLLETAKKEFEIELGRKRLDHLNKSPKKYLPAL